MNKIIKRNWHWGHTHTHTETTSIWQQTKNCPKTKTQINLRELLALVIVLIFRPPLMIIDTQLYTIYSTCIHKVPHLKLTCPVLEFGTSTLGLSMAPPFTVVAWPTPCQHKNTLTVTSHPLEDPKQPHRDSMFPTEPDAKQFAIEKP